jgi:uncharacterized membrane protein YeaQ/YmgE (transglycosylase-associated protein family)
VDWISTIIVALLAGLILGPLARLLVPGKQKIGIVMTVLVGAGAALVGGIIATALGVGETSGIDWIKHLIQVVLAVLGVMAVASMAGGDGLREPDRPAS